LNISASVGVAGRATRLRGEDPYETELLSDLREEEEECARLKEGEGMRLVVLARIRSRGARRLSQDFLCPTFNDASKAEALGGEEWVGEGGDVEETMRKDPFGLLVDLD
jgi:hypothetical protein